MQNPEEKKDHFYTSYLMLLCINTTDIKHYFVNGFHIMTKSDNFEYKRYQYGLAQCACLVVYLLRTDKHTGDKEMFFFQLDEFFS